MTGLAILPASHFRFLIMAEAGTTADRIDTKATVTQEKVDGDFAVSTVHLVAKVSNADRAEFEKAANAARENCPISRLRKAKITLDARLEA